MTNAGQDRVFKTTDLNAIILALHGDIAALELRSAKAQQMIEEERDIATTVEGQVAELNAQLGAALERAKIVDSRIIQMKVEMQTTMQSAYTTDEDNCRVKVVNGNLKANIESLTIQLDAANC